MVVAVNWLRMAEQKNAGNMSLITWSHTKLTNLEQTYLGYNYFR